MKKDKRSNDKIIIFFAPLSALRKRTRLAKIISIFLKNDYSIIFYGWERIKNELQENCWNDSNVTEKTILKGGGYVSNKARLMYPLWMIRVFIKALQTNRNQTLFCLGWESAFPALIASFFTKSRIIFDDADRFSMILKLPSLLNNVLVFLEKWTSKKSFIHLIPGWSRYTWKNEKMVVLKNSPNLEDFNKAKITQLQKNKNYLNIYINGWVGDSRGAPIFLKALNIISDRNENILFHIAGRIDSKNGELLINHKNSIFYGEIPQNNALELYNISDLVLTYYDPSIEINIHAESNKWGDCVFFGKPFIVNSEVLTAKNFISSGGAWSLNYSDATGLADLLIYLSKNKSQLDFAAKAIKNHTKDYPIFDSQILNIIEILKK